MTALKSMVSGLAGAAALTVLHESARRLIPHAPRVDVIGKRAIARPMQAMGLEPPRGKKLYAVTLAGEVLSNGLYYALTGVGKAEHPYRRGALLGLMGGLGAVALPGPMGLGRQPGQRTPVTQAMTIAWYTIGGMAAGAVAGWLEGHRESRGGCC